MTEEIKNNESKYSDSEQEQRLPEEVPAAVKPLDDEEDNIATPEDMEEFIRSRRERREERPVAAFGHERVGRIGECDVERASLPARRRPRKGVRAYDLRARSGPERRDVCRQA